MCFGSFSPSFIFPHPHSGVEAKPTLTSTANMRDWHLKSQRWFCRSRSRVKFSPPVDEQQLVQGKKRKNTNHQNQWGGAIRLDESGSFQQECTWLSPLCSNIQPSRERYLLTQHSDRFLFQEQKIRMPTVLCQFTETSVLLFHKGLDQKGTSVYATYVDFAVESNTF